jgi:hypothetical protein
MKTQANLDIDDLKLGTSSDELETETSEDCRRLATLMVNQAQHRVRIISRYLDPPLFNTEEFVAAVKQLLLSRKAGRVEIIVKDSGPLMRRGHRLVALAQRLSSYIEIRKPGRSHSAFNAGVLLVDECGYLNRMFADRYEGNASFNDIRTCKALTDSFQEMWQAGEPDPNLRRLS